MTRTSHFQFVRILHDGYKRQVAIAAGGVQSIAHDKFVWNNKAGVIDL